MLTQDFIDQVNKSTIFDDNSIPTQNVWTKFEIKYIRDINQIPNEYLRHVNIGLMYEYRNRIRQGYTIPFCVVYEMTHSCTNIESVLAALDVYDKSIPFIKLSLVDIDELINYGNDSPALVSLLTRIETNHQTNRFVDKETKQTVVDFDIVDTNDYFYDDLIIDLKRFYSVSQSIMNENVNRSISTSYNAFLTCLNAICNQVVQTGVHSNKPWLNDQNCYIDKDNQSSIVLKPIQVGENNTKLDVYLNGEIVIGQSNLNISDVETVSKAIISSISPLDWGNNIQKALLSHDSNLIDPHDWFDYFTQLLKSSLVVNTICQPKVSSTSDKITSNRILSVKVGNVTLQIIEDSKIYNFIMTYDMCYLGRLNINDKTVDKIKKDFVSLIEKSSNGINFETLRSWIKTINKTEC